MSGYTPHGPFTDAAPPGIDQSFLNDVETFLGTINSAATDTHISSAIGILALLGLNVNPTPVVVNGTTAGTATLYQWMTGTVKAALLVLNNYQNNTTTQQTIALPTPFSSQAFVFTGPGPLLAPYRAGVLQAGGIRVVSGLSASTTGGTFSAQNYIPSHSYGVFTTAPDAIGLGVSQSSAFVGIAFFIGV